MTLELTNRQVAMIYHIVQPAIEKMVGSYTAEELKDVMDKLRRDIRDHP